MGSLMLGGSILVAAFLLFTTAAGRRASGGPGASGMISAPEAGCSRSWVR
jgi:hypothetical protein